MHLRVLLPSFALFAAIWSGVDIMTSLGFGIAEFARHGRGFQHFTACFCGHKTQQKIAKQRAKSVQVAPVTSQHILKLAKLGAYNTVSFFRVDKGFVAQTADVVYGRLEGAPLDARQLVRTFSRVQSSYCCAPRQTSVTCMLPGKHCITAMQKPAETRHVTRTV